MAQKILVIKNLLLFLNILGLGAIGYFTWFQTEAGKDLTAPKTLVKEFFDTWEEKKGLSHKELPKEIVSKISLPLEVVVANLAQVDEDSHFLTFYPVLTFKQKSGVSESRFAPHIPMVRDQILKVVNARTKNQLLEKEGKASLKNELKLSLNALNIPYVVEGIFFTGFVVQ